MKILNVFLFISLLNFTANANAETVSGVSEGIKFSYEKTRNDYKDTFFNLSEKEDTEVLYFFNYNCFSCYMLNPYIESWEKSLKKENVKLIKVPVNILNNWEYTVKLHFIMKILGFENYSESIFDSIHRKGLNFSSDKDIYDFLYSEYEMHSEIINLPHNLNRINYMLDKSNIVSDILNVSSTPSIVVQNKNWRYVIKIQEGMNPLSFIVSLQKILFEKVSSPNIN